MGYKSTHSFETRCAESERVSRKYLDRVPVICERLEGSAISAVDKIKFLVPLDLTILRTIRGLLSLASIPTLSGV
jgi:GABA(A) receptor-associated protein